jgi:hypothetical protein
MEKRCRSESELREGVIGRFCVGERVWVDSAALGWRVATEQRQLLRIISFHPYFVTMRAEAGFMCSLLYDDVENFVEPFEAYSGFGRKGKRGRLVHR